jgi:hypothetical protein
VTDAAVKEPIRAEVRSMAAATTLPDSV